MKLSNTHILSLFRWLNVPLHGEELRARNQFIALIDKQKKEIDSQREAALEEIADKDESGKAIIENGIYKIAEEKKEAFQAKMNEFLAETVEIEATGSLKMAVKDLLMTKMSRGLDIEEGKIFEEIMAVMV